MRTGFWWGDLNEKCHVETWAKMEEKYKSKMEGRGLDSSGSGCGQITASCEHYN